MVQLKTKISHNLPPITWEKLPDDYILPDEPVENNLQPLLASALRESLELAGLILESMLIATNFGICAKVGDKTVVKAPDWVYVSSVKPLTEGVIRRSYTPNLEGEKPTIVMEFISETECGEYSINPHFPYGKWFFYEQILQIPIYVIFHPKTGELDLYRLQEGKYISQKPDENNRYWIKEIGLYLGIWQGEKSQINTYWLRWWDQEHNLLLWSQELIAQEKQKIELEKQRADAEKQRADAEKQRADTEKQRAEEAKLLLAQEKEARQKLLDKLAEKGISLDDFDE
jgi:hypothetical protein